MAEDVAEVVQEISETVVDAPTSKRAVEEEALLERKSAKNAGDEGPAERHKVSRLFGRKS